MLNVIHELQRLQRRVAAIAEGADRFAIRHVEVRQKRRGRRALEERIETAAVQRRAVLALEETRVRSREAHGLPDVRRLVRLDALAADFEIDQAADEERVVAALLGIQAQARSAR